MAAELSSPLCEWPMRKGGLLEGSRSSVCSEPHVKHICRQTLLLQVHTSSLHIVVTLTFTRNWYSTVLHMTPLYLLVSLVLPRPSCTSVQATVHAIRLHFSCHFYWKTLWCLWKHSDPYRLDSHFSELSICSSIWFCLIECLFSVPSSFSFLYLPFMMLGRQIVLNKLV